MPNENPFLAPAASNPFLAPASPATAGGGSGGNSNPFLAGSTRVGAQPEGNWLERFRNFDSPKGRASFANAVGNRFSPLGEALDYQLHANLHRATGEADPNKQMKALRTQLGDEENYEQAPWPERGLYDFNTQIRYDPLQYEMAAWGEIPGAVAGIGTRAARMLGPVAKAALAASPELVKTAVADTGHGIQGIRHGLTRLLAPGGKAAGELENQRGRGMRDILLGAAGKHALNEQEMTRAFTARFDETIKGLEPQEETNIYRALNGERSAEGFNDKEQAAYAGLRKLADEAAYSEARPMLRWLISLRHGGLGKPLPETNLYRYQQTPGVVEKPGLRGGTFFSRDPKTAEAYNEAGMRWGGLSRVQRTAVPKNPLDIGQSRDFTGASSLPHLLGADAGTNLRKKFQAERILKNVEGPRGEDYARRYLRALGVPADQAENIGKDMGRHGEIFADRLAAEVAKRKGYDAIQSSHEYFALDPSAHTAGRKTFTAKAPELEPFDPALAPTWQQIVAEDERISGAGNPRLSRALYPLGRTIKKSPKVPPLPLTPAGTEIRPLGKDVMSDPAFRKYGSLDAYKQAFQKEHGFEPTHVVWAGGKPFWASSREGAIGALTDPARQKFWKDVSGHLASTKNVPAQGVSEWMQRESSSLPHPAQEYELYRYQNAAGEAQFSPGSTSTYYSMGKPPLHPAYKTSAPFPTVGGAHLVTEKYAPKNPLKLPLKSGSVGAAIIKQFYGPERAAEIGKSANRIASGEHGADEAADALAVELGIHPAGRQAGAYASASEMSPWEQSLGHETGASNSAILDRLGAEVARQAGHDAVVMEPGQFVRLYERGKAPGEPPPPFGAPKSEDELDAFLNEHAHPKPRPLPFSHSESGTITNPTADEVLGKKPPTRRFVTKGRAKVAPLAVSPDIAEFVGPGGRRREYRWRYLPGYNQTAEAPKQEAFEFNPLRWENPNLKEREEFFVDPKQHENQREAFRRMLGNAARESSVASLARELPERGLPLQPDVIDALQRHVAAKGDERSALQKVGDAYKGVLRYGRAAQVGLTPFHAANIAGLQLAHAPSTIPESVGTTIRALLPGANRHEIFRKGREMGALAPSKEQIAPFAKASFPLRAGIGAATGGYAGYNSDRNATPDERLLRTGLGALAGVAAGAALPAWSRGMTHGVFTYDDAAKQALAKHYAARHGMTKPYQAGRQAAEDLVDYANPSELGGALSWVSKFPTYRSQLPFSAARGIARHPGRFAAINRATGGIAAGGTAQTPVGPVKSYSSIADVGRMASDLKGYARSTLADPVKIALSLAEKFNAIPRQQWGYYFTYKLDPTSKAVLLSAGLAGIPEARSILQEAGAGMFPANPMSSTLPLPVREGLFDITGLNVGN